MLHPYTVASQDAGKASETATALSQDVGKTAGDLFGILQHEARFGG